jgi:hypothetical protein
MHYEISPIKKIESLNFFFLKNICEKKKYSHLKSEKEEREKVKSKKIFSRCYK